MRETISDYPALQMQDDGFLMSIKSDFVDRRDELFDLPSDMDFKDAIEFLVSQNASCTDVGASLPLYVPVMSDDGVIVASKAVPVWSGVHIGFPLYPGLSNDAVESFLYGNPRRIFSLGNEFMACDPAFKLALLVHFTIENVIIHEMAVEMFVLGMYHEYPFPDEHYEQTGLPSTALARVAPSVSLSRKRSRTAPNEYCIAIGSAKTDGWIVRVRGTKPKENVLRDCWQEMRARNAESRECSYTVDGKGYRTVEVGEGGRVRTRSGSADVDYMIAWIESLKQSGRFPMRGTRLNWVEAHRRFEKENPDYINFWSVDTMRRTYKRRTQSK